MEWNETILTKLGTTNTKDALLEIHIATIQTCDLSRAQPGAHKQPDNREQGCSSDGVKRRNFLSGLQQACEFVFSQKPRGRNGSRTRKRLRIQSFGTRIENGKIIGEVSQHSIASCPDVGSDLTREHKLEHQVLGQWASVRPAAHEAAKCPKEQRLAVEGIS